MKTVFQQLGPYEIIEAIGHGMAGNVFMARDTRTDQLVALKLVPRGTDRDALEILAAERSGTELQTQLKQVSAHVPAVFEHGDHESGYYVAMEYFDGENLSNLISRGPLPAGQAVAIAIELCLFLEDAHRFKAVIGNREFRSLVHGDLTPQNVRITSSRSVKVLDFGIAKALSLSRKVTRNDFGTLWYLSPERLESGVVDEYSDFWAVGVMLYEMVRGTRPFQATDTHRLEHLIRARGGAPSLDGLCPRGVESIVAKLLAPTPAERYNTAHAIREDLERATAGQVTQAEQERWPRSNVDPIGDEPQTRRTQPALDAGEEETTRRTVKAEDRPNPDIAPPMQRRMTLKKVRRFAVVALLVIVVAITANDIWVSRGAAEAAAAVPTRELEQLGGLWDRYDDLSKQAFLRFATTRGLGHSLVERSSVLADRVIANYRMPVPTVREAQWQSARAALARAVSMAPHDARLKAALRYCEGHLHRINGEAKRSRRQFADAQGELTEAVAAFREAAELRPGWPDPFLGLARTFIYGLQDIDRGADALRQAERNGYSPGDRETVQLADGYRLRGDTLTHNAKELHGMAQERDYLDRASEAYRQSLTLYLSLKDLSNMGGTIRAVQRALDSVEKRIDEMSGVGTKSAPSVTASSPEPGQ